MSTDQTILGYSLDDYFKTTMIGSIRQSITNNLYGINHRQIPNMVPTNKDRYGYTFFTRPQLNLTDGNLTNNRLFFPLLSKNPNSLHSYVRSMLDPRLGTTAIISNVTDNFNSFIPVLTNNLKSISGWDDLLLPTSTSPEGLYGESFSFGDGYLVNYKNFDLTASFANTRGDPIMYLFYIWLLYISAVFEGTMVPYADFILENEIDYTTRIYRLVMDQTNTYVRKIAATGAAFPIALPSGGFFDYTADSTFNNQVTDISLRFRCMGMIYQDSILVDNFNQVVGIFNSDMKAVNNGLSNNVTKIEPDLLPLFNNRGYPRINPATSELEWWVDLDVYNDRLNALISGGNTNENYAMLKDIVDLRNSSQKNGPIPSPTTGGYGSGIEDLSQLDISKK